MMTQADLKKVLKIFRKIEVNEDDVNELVSVFREKSENHYDKRRDEKADAYDSMADALETFLESYEELYNQLSDNEAL